jgi:hypothetical protein
MRHFGQRLNFQIRIDILHMFTKKKRIGFCLTFDVTMFVYYGAEAPVFSRILFTDINVGVNKCMSYVNPSIYAGENEC